MTTARSAAAAATRSGPEWMEMGMHQDAAHDDGGDGDDDDEDIDDTPLSSSGEQRCLLRGAASARHVANCRARATNSNEAERHLQ